MRRSFITSALLTGAIFVIGAVITDAPRQPARAAATPSATSEPAKEEQLSPEEQMRRRHPQPARVRDVVGLPVLDWSDNTLGYVQRIVRTRDGNIQLIVRYGGWFGWIGWWQRSVAVPIELVALIGPHVGALDMTPEQFRNASTWQPSADSTEIPGEEVIRVAITRR